MVFGRFLGDGEHKAKIWGQLPAGSPMGNVRDKLSSLRILPLSLKGWGKTEPLGFSLS